MKTSIDIHGFTEAMAIKEIEQTIAKLPKETKELIVIHGHRSGDALKQMVASPYKIRSKRIKRRRYSKNPGETILELY